MFLLKKSGRQYSFDIPASINEPSEILFASRNVWNLLDFPIIRLATKNRGNRMEWIILDRMVGRSTGESVVGDWRASCKNRVIDCRKWRGALPRSKARPTRELCRGGGRLSIGIKKIGEGKMSLIHTTIAEAVCELCSYLASKCFLRGRPPGRPFSLRTSRWDGSSSQGRCTCTGTRRLLTLPISRQKIEKRFIFSCEIDTGGRFTVRSRQLNEKLTNILVNTCIILWSRVLTLILFWLIYVKSWFIILLWKLYSRYQYRKIWSSRISSLWTFYYCKSNY